MKHDGTNIQCTVFTDVYDRRIYCWMDRFQRVCNSKGQQVHSQHTLKCLMRAGTSFLMKSTPLGLITQDFDSSEGPLND